jgi:hypothetical protein
MDTFSRIPNIAFLNATPEQGRQMAARIAPLIIKATQPSVDKREQLREIYADDPQTLIAAANN